MTTCLALLTAGALGVSDTARAQRQSLQDAFLDALAHVSYPLVRLGHPLLSLVLPPVVDGERTLVCVMDDGTGASTVTAHLWSRFPQPLTFDSVALVVDRASTGTGAAAASGSSPGQARFSGTQSSTTEAYVAERVEVAPDGATVVRLVYRVCRARAQAAA